MTAKTPRASAPVKPIPSLFTDFIRQNTAERDRRDRLLRIHCERVADIETLTQSLAHAGFEHVRVRPLYRLAQYARNDELTFRIDLVTVGSFNRGLLRLQRFLSERRANIVEQCPQYGEMRSEMLLCKLYCGEEIRLVVWESDWNARVEEAS